MRDAARRDGCTVVYDEAESDMIVVEPVVTGFTAARGGACCTACGAPLQSWGWRHATGSEVELVCVRCHQVHGRFQLGSKVHR
jgi:hypothetical protein